MTKISAYLTLSHNNLAVIAAGDEIEIIDAFSRDNYQIGLIRAARGRGGQRDYMVAKVYPRHWQKIPAGGGKISSLVNDGLGLIVTIENCIGQ